MTNEIFYIPTTTGEQAATGSDNAVSSWGLNFGGANGGLGSGSSFGYQVPNNIDLVGFDSGLGLGSGSSFGLKMPTNNNLTGLGADLGKTTPPPEDIDWGKSLGIGLQGLQALAGLWTAYNGTQSLKLAKSAYNTQKDLAYKNLGNSIKSYNTALSDRLRARAAMETGDKNAYDDQIKENELKD